MPRAAFNRGLLVSVSFTSVRFFFFGFPILVVVPTEEKEKKTKERSHGSLSLYVFQTHTQKKRKWISKRCFSWPKSVHTHVRNCIHASISLSFSLFFFFFTPSLPFCFFDTYCKYTHTHTLTWAPDIRGVFFFLHFLFFSRTLWVVFVKLLSGKLLWRFFFLKLWYSKRFFFFFSACLYFFLFTHIRWPLHQKKSHHFFFFLKYIGKSLFSVLKRRERH